MYSEKDFFFQIFLEIHFLINAKILANDYSIFLYLHLRVTIENIFDKNTKLAYKVGIPHAVVVFSQIYFVGIYKLVSFVVLSVDLEHFCSRYTSNYNLKDKIIE